MSKIAPSQITPQTINKAIVTDSSGNITSSTTSDTEIGYLSGVTSSLQTQLNTKLSSGTTVTIAQGGTGQTTQQAALNALAGSTTSAQFLRGNGTNVILDSIQASDVPTLNQNTTGTASNVTASSNSSLTTLSALSLPGSQVSGNISGNATNVTGTVAISNGGTGQTTRQAALNALAGTQSNNKVLRSDGTNTTLSSLITADIPSTLNPTNVGINVTAGTGALKIKATGAATDSAFVLLSSDGAKEFDLYTDTTGFLYLKNAGSSQWPLVVTNVSNVGIGTASPDSSTSLTVSQPVDQKQLAVRGHTTQTGNLQIWENSSNTVLAFVDPNGNFKANNTGSSYTTTVTGASTTTLTLSSTQLQYFTGTTTQTLVLPVVTTLYNGYYFIINNLSTGAVTINTSGGNTLLTLGASQQATITCINTAGGTGIGSWSYIVATATPLANPMTTLGDLLYGGASGATTRLAGDTSNTRKFLREQSSGGVATAPTWDTIVAGDIPTLNQNTTGTASNITATSNSTLTTLSALSLPGSQVSGNISGNAANVTGTIAVDNGGTGQTSYTDGQLLIGNSTGNTLNKTSLTAGSGITITPGGGSITIAATGTSTPIASKTGNYTIVSNDGTILCDASAGSFTITLPTASTVANQKFIIRRTDNTLANTVTISGTIDGASDWKLYTIDECLEIQSNSTEYKKIRHDCDTGWITDTTANVQYFTNTITTGSATIAATYVPAFKLTFTSGINVTAAAVYTEAVTGHTFTAVTTVAASTTAYFTGAFAPTLTNNWTRTSGTGDATITSANMNTSSGNTNAVTYTVCKTVASGTTLIMQGGSGTLNANGQYAKVTGTGDTLITYTSYTGGPSNILATTGINPVFYGTPITNTSAWMRRGNLIILAKDFYQDTAGPVAGTSTDYTFPTPTGITIDTTIMPLYTGGAAQTQINTTAATMANWTMTETVGIWTTNGGSYGQINFATPYTNTSFRVYHTAAGPAPWLSIGSTYGNAAAILVHKWHIALPVSGWKA